MTIPVPSQPDAARGDVIVHVFGRTDVGRTREHNEDAFIVVDLSADNASLQADVRTHVVGPRGTLFMVQKALPLFNDGGSIFMTGSVASIKGFPGYSVYAASKAALHAFARGWLNELKGRNIRVNVLHPGPIATPMQDQVLTEEAKRMFESLIPRGKMGRPEEIAAAALFLASDDSSFVNGVELSVDGGFSAI